MIFRNKIKLTKEEKIRAGFQKKWKLLIPVFFIVVFLVLVGIVKKQQSKVSNSEEISISLKLQHQIYESFKQSVKEIKTAARQKYPKKDINLRQDNKYKEFVTFYTEQATKKITKYYRISKGDYGKIVLKGINDNWK